jgi:pyruvate-ferredoxin/flavodoxin oxidoreductase
MPLAEYRKHEDRFQSLAREHPEEADRLMKIAQQAAYQRWDLYEKMASRRAAEFAPDPRREV